jgi:hypothetical protein
MFHRETAAKMHQTSSFIYGPIAGAVFTLMPPVSVGYFTFSEYTAPVYLAMFMTTCGLILLVSYFRKIPKLGAAKVDLSLLVELKEVEHDQVPLLEQEQEQEDEEEETLGQAHAQLREHESTGARKHPLGHGLDLSHTHTTRPGSGDRISVHSEEEDQARASSQPHTHPPVHRHITTTTTTTTATATALTDDQPTQRAVPALPPASRTRRELRRRRRARRRRRKRRGGVGGFLAAIGAVALGSGSDPSSSSESGSSSSSSSESEFESEEGNLSELSMSSEGEEEESEQEEGDEQYEGEEQRLGERDAREPGELRVRHHAELSVPLGDEVVLSGEEIMGMAGGEAEYAVDGNDNDEIVGLKATEDEGLDQELGDENRRNRGGMLVCLGLYFVIMLCFSLFETVVTPITDSFGWSTLANGIAYAVFGCLSVGTLVVLNLLIARNFCLPSRFCRKKDSIVLLLGFVIMLLGAMVVFSWFFTLGPARFFVGMALIISFGYVLAITEVLTIYSKLIGKKRPVGGCRSRWCSPAGCSRSCVWVCVCICLCLCL